MTTELAKNLEAGTILQGSGDGYDEIIKVLSNGYLVFHYSLAHYCYSIEFLNFDTLVDYNYELCSDSWVADIFDGKLIHRIDSNYYKSIVD